MLYSGRIRVPEDAREAFVAYAGRRGLLRLLRLSFEGFDPTDLLLPIVALDDGQLLETYLAHRLLHGSIDEKPPPAKASALKETIEVATSRLLAAFEPPIDAQTDLRYQRARLLGSEFLRNRLRALNDRRDAVRRNLEQAPCEIETPQGTADPEPGLLRPQSVLGEIEETLASLRATEQELGSALDDSSRSGRYGAPKVEHVFDLDLVIEVGSL